jgi:hypothetical protein
MRRLKQTFYVTADSLEEELRIKTVIFIPYPVMIVPLVEFVSYMQKPNAAQLKSLKRWFQFWFVVFTPAARLRAKFWLPLWGGAEESSSGCLRLFRRGRSQHLRLSLRL